MPAARSPSGPEGASGSSPAASARRRAIRSSLGGWVRRSEGSGTAASMPRDRLDVMLSGDGEESERLVQIVSRGNWVERIKPLLSRDGRA